MEYVYQPLIGLAAWILVSLFSSGAFYQSLPVCAKLLAYIAFFLWAFYFWNSKHKKIFFALVLLTGLVQLAFVYGQVFAGKPGLGLYHNNQNYVGLHMAVCALLCLAACRKSCFLLLPGFLLFTGFAIGVIIVHSRSAMLGMICGILFLVCKTFSRRVFLGWGLCLVFVIALLPGKVFVKLAKLDDPYVSGRLLIWRSAYKLIGEHPFTGVGSGNFEDSMLTYQLPLSGMLARYSRMTPFAHNDYLQIASELGLPALFFSLWCLWILLKSGVSSLAAKSCVLAAMSIAFVDFPFYKPANAFILLGLAAVSANVPVSACSKNKLKYLIAGLSFLALTMWFLSFFVWNVPKLESLADQAWIRAFDERTEASVRSAGLSIAEYLRYNPDDSFAWERLGAIAAGFINKNTADMQLAFRYYDKALRLNSFHAPWYVERGNLHLLLGEFSMARNDFCQAILLEPYYLGAHRALAAAFYLEGKSEVSERFKRYAGNMENRVREQLSNGQLLSSGSAYEKIISE